MIRSLPRLITSINPPCDVKFRFGWDYIRHNLYNGEDERGASFSENIPGFDAAPLFGVAARGLHLYLRHSPH